MLLFERAGGRLGRQRGGGVTMGYAIIVGTVVLLGIFRLAINDAAPAAGSGSACCGSPSASAIIARR
jgi:hypothetical protein